MDRIMNNNKRRIICIIQARMKSTRLPGKSMMPLAGKPLLQHVLERAKLAQLLDEVVLAIPVNKEDDILVGLAEKIGVKLFRGHPTDLVHRYYHAAKAFNADIVVRIPADNPLIHPSEIDRIIAYYMNEDVDFASNIAPFLGNEYPDGLGAEVFSFKLLEQIYNTVNDTRHREHVTTYFREHPEKFRLGTVKCPAEFRRPDIVLDVNTSQEYEFMVELFEDLSKEGELIHINEIIPWYDSKKRVLSN
jgi:spore coat polysaccharide biosynthesis protein SpsF